MCASQKVRTLNSSTKFLHTLKRLLGGSNAYYEIGIHEYLIHDFKSGLSCYKRTLSQGPLERLTKHSKLHMTPSGRMKEGPLILKFMFFKKATKFDKIFTEDLTLCSKCQINSKDFVNFCGLLRKHEL